MPSFTQITWDLVLVFVFFHLATLGIKKVVFVDVVSYMSSCPQYLQTDRTEVHGAIRVLSGLSGNRFSPVQAVVRQGYSCYRLNYYYIQVKIF